MSRGPNTEFQEWWNKQRERSGDTFIDNENPVGSYSTTLLAPKKDRTRSARQISWAIRLKFQHIASFFGRIFSKFVSIIRFTNRRISSPDSPADSSSIRFYGVIKVFLVLVIFLLGFELFAYFKGWHFSPPSALKAAKAAERVYAQWLEIRLHYLGPVLQGMANTCTVLFLVQSLDRAVLVLGCFWIRVRGIKPKAVMEYPQKKVDASRDNVEDYPMVMVQIPMCNEKEVISKS